LLLGVTALEALPWSAAPRGLLDRDGFEHVFAVETDDAGRATLRFGDDVYGMSPPDGAFVRTSYRVGLGLRGNVGAEALHHLLKPDPGFLLPDIVEVRNPLPAFGGADPEPIERVKRLAPEAFRAVSRRAVTEADYAAVAEQHADVSHARATFRWTGSWHTVFLTVDPKGRIGLDDTLRQSVLDWVERFTQTGYDLEIQPPIYVPLQLELHVCAKRGHFRAEVERAVLGALSAEPGHFFDRDRITFGQPLYLSALYAAVEAVPGVDSVTALRFSRQRDDDPDPARPISVANVDRGYIAAGRLEVLELENDSSLPERGVLRLVMGGGS
jgi:predicted phage baseplate assembly protein